MVRPKRQTGPCQRHRALTIEHLDAGDRHGPLTSPQARAGRALRAGLLSTTQDRWGRGLGGWEHPLPLPLEPPPSKRLGQIFFATYFRPKIFFGAFGASKN